MDDYVNALDAGNSHLSDGYRGRHIIEIILAIFESGAYRRPITLPQAAKHGWPVERTGELP